MTGTATGTLTITKKGFGFVVTGNENERDIFVSRGSLNGAMHGDTVEVEVSTGSIFGFSTNGEVTKILRRANKDIVGTFEQIGKQAFVVPGDRRMGDLVSIQKSEQKGALDGDWVSVRIMKYPESGQAAEGKVTEIISRAGAPGGDIKALVRLRGLVEAFPKKAEAEARAVAQKAVDATGRVDLRGETTFTIDGEDAKDLDDAVSIEKNDKGNFLLGVHIADVSSYVAENGALDREALKRGTSVYLIDQVVPMLPKALSNGACSLNRGEDRLTLSVDMEITPEGETASYSIYESVIRTCERMVYSDVSDMLENEDASLIKRYSGIYNEILMMGELAGILKARRDERGSIDFDLDESHIRLDSFGKAESIGVAERRTANRLIEEFMLAANETVAEHFFHIGVPFVYRVHEKPAAEKMREFKTFIKNFGLSLKGSTGNIHPRSLNMLLKSIEGKPYENVVNTVMLRSMQKAFYSTDCRGHFGLGLKYYCHFTSPIRRYPDLMIHRIIKESLAGPVEPQRLNALDAKAAVAAEASSISEKKAQELEREVEKMKKAEYMLDHVGEAFEGVVSGVTQYGLYVQLPNTVEGMVRAGSLGNDHFEYEPDKYRLVGVSTKKAFSLGDKLDIVVKSADVAERTVDFAVKEQW